MNSEEFPLQEDFQHWKRGAGFCFCHYPFVFEAASKAVLLDIENQGEQVSLLSALLPEKLCFNSLRPRAPIALPGLRLPRWCTTLRAGSQVLHVLY